MYTTFIDKCFFLNIFKSKTFCQDFLILLYIIYFLTLMSFKNLLKNLHPALYYSKVNDRIIILGLLFLYRQTHE